MKIHHTSYQLSELVVSVRFLFGLSLHHVQEFHREEACGHGHKEHRLRTRTTFCRYDSSCFCSYTASRLLFGGFVSLVKRQRIYFLWQNSKFDLCRSPFIFNSGKLPFDLCQRYVEGIVLINDEEIKAAVSTLYRSGLVVEPSGSAAFAAIVNNKIPDLEEKNVVCILSGGNIGKDELANFQD